MNQTPPLDRTVLRDGGVLREAHRGDEEGILSYIQGLVDYEKEPDAVDNAAAMA